MHGDEMKVKSFSRKQLAVVLIVVTVALASCSGILVYMNAQQTPKQLERVTVSHPSFETLALFWVAQEQGYLTQNGLNITANKYDTGAAALDAMLNDQADIALGPAEYPVVGRALPNQTMKIIGSVDALEFIYLIARKDRGIETAPDLAGKTVGTARGTISEFYLGRLLSLNGMSMQNITLVDLKTPAEWVNAVVNGTVDAVLTTQPQANMAKEGLEENAYFTLAQSDQPMFALIIAKDQWIQTHPETVTNFLKALSAAEEFIQNHPQEAKTIVKNQMSFTDQYMETVWQQNQYGLSLYQSLLHAMEDEARWQINNGLTKATEMPDFLQYVYLDGLNAVSPESVTIVR
jgi:NitT/TauT family transport system substrate-binding protein